MRLEWKKKKRALVRLSLSFFFLTSSRPANGPPLRNLPPRRPALGRPAGRAGCGRAARRRRSAWMMRGRCCAGDKGSDYLGTSSQSRQAPHSVRTGQPGRGRVAVDTARRLAARLAAVAHWSERLGRAAGGQAAPRPCWCTRGQGPEPCAVTFEGIGRAQPHSGRVLSPRRSNELCFFHPSCLSIPPLPAGPARPPPPRSGSTRPTRPLLPHPRRPHPPGPG